VKKLLAVILVSGLVFTFAACKKNEEKLQQPDHPSMQGGMQMTMFGMQKRERAVVVPKEVQAKWTAVKLMIADKAAKTSKEYTVAVGSDLTIPNTKMKISVLAFLPDFKMSDKEITSASSTPNNPAVQVLIQESSKEEWKGWLFSSHSNIHPFSHEQISIKLMGGVPK
jgi:hypothetical protein